MIPIIIILFLSIVWPDALTPEEANMLTLSHCIHPKSIPVDYSKMDILPVIHACAMETQRARREGREVRKMVIMSNCRPDDEGSMHEFCAAIDFYYWYIDGWDSCQVWMTYKKDSMDLYDWFFTIAWEQYMGQGVYMNLTHHIHGDGERDLWGFDTTGNQVTFHAVHELIDEKIEEECN